MGMRFKKEPFGTDLVDYPKMVLKHLHNYRYNSCYSLFAGINPNRVAHKLGQAFGVGINVFFEAVVMDIHQSQTG